jgi:hypothetical protein
VIRGEHDPERRGDLVEAGVPERQRLDVADDVVDIQPAFGRTLLRRLDEDR